VVSYIVIDMANKKQLTSHECNVVYVVGGADTVIKEVTSSLEGPEISLKSQFPVNRTFELSLEGLVGGLHTN
jgi:hypothetical protein